MAEQCTPTTEDIRENWAEGWAEGYAQFDRWLREHDAALIESLADDPTLRLSGHSGISIREKARERREGVS